MCYDTKTSGFTLIELVVAMAVVSTTLGIAIPSFQNMTDRYRLKGATEAIFYSLHTARAQAIKSNSAVTAAFQTGSNWNARLSDSSACAINAVSCVGGDWVAQTLSNEFKGTQISATTSPPTTRPRSQTWHSEWRRHHVDVERLRCAGAIECFGQSKILF